MMINESPILTNEGYGINRLAYDTLLPFSTSFNNYSVNGNVVEIDGDYEIPNELGLDCSKIVNNRVSLRTNGSGNIDINYIFDMDHVLVNEIYIDILHDSKINIMYSGVNEFCKSLIKLNVNDGVSVNFNVINMLSGKDYLSEVFVNLGASSSINSTIVDMGGSKRVMNYQTNLVGDDALSTIKNIYMGFNNDLVDYNYLSKVLGKRCNSSLNVVGTLSDSATKSFKGTIDFKKGCTSSIASEDEYCIALSNGVVSNSLPNMLCEEENVNGTHSTATGELDKTQIYYLMSRGISYEDALKLLVKAKFKDMLSNLEDDCLERVNLYVEEMLS